MRRASGFTLLEVMGAVVILGIIGVSLITASMDSAYRAAQARDRMGTSLVADSLIAELETRARAGGLEPGTQHSQTDDGLEIVIETRPASLIELAAGALLERDRDDGPAELLEEQRGAPASLLQIHVQVTDPGGGVVERTGFVFDPAASEALQALAPQGAPGGLE